MANYFQHFVKIYHINTHMTNIFYDHKNTYNVNIENGASFIQTELQTPEFTMLQTTIKTKPFY